MDGFTAFLDFMSVVAALVLAINGRIPLRAGANHYERKRNLTAQQWNRIWTVMFWGAFGCAALSLGLKYFAS